MAPDLTRPSVGGSARPRDHVVVFPWELAIQWSISGHSGRRENVAYASS